MDIIVKILEFVDNKGATLKTHILYSANLNSKSLDKFLSNLIESGLISTYNVNEKSYYFVTARGRIFLKYISKALVILNSRKYSAIYEKIKHNLNKKNRESTTVKEGLIFKGTSGIPYVLSLAFMSQDGSKVVAGTEIITSEMTIKEAINVIAWTWIACKDMNISSVILIPETHAQILDKVMEPFIKSKAPTLTLVTYSRYESAEAVANRLIDAVRKATKE